MLTRRMLFARSIGAALAGLSPKIQPALCASRGAGPASARDDVPGDRLVNHHGWIVYSADRQALLAGAAPSAATPPRRASGAGVEVEPGRRR